MWKTLVYKTSDLEGISYLEGSGTSGRHKLEKLFHSYMFRGKSISFPLDG